MHWLGNDHKVDQEFNEAPPNKEKIDANEFLIKKGLGVCHEFY
jgi:hypothetical protein